MSLTKEEMRQKYFEITGIKLSTDDPIFSVGQLTEIVTKSVMDSVHDTLKELPEKIEHIAQQTLAKHTATTSTTLAALDEAIENKLKLVEQSASRLSDEALNAQIEAQATKICESLSKQLEITLAPLAKAVQHSEKLKENGEYVVSHLAKRHLNYGKIAIFSVIACLFGATASGLAAQQYVMKDISQLRRESLNYEAAFWEANKVLSKKDAEKYKIAFVTALIKEEKKQK